MLSVSGLLARISRALEKVSRRLAGVSVRVKKVLRWITATFLVVEFLALATAGLIDSLRKGRTSGADGYPRTPPTPIKIADSEVVVYTDGAETYAAMLQAIREAQDHIFFETFIWKADEVGTLFKDELIAAARRGVEVFCIWDAFANLVVTPSFKRFPRIAHLHVLSFPLFRGWPSIRNSGRDHRKILVVDSKIGFVGGYNIGTLYATQWRDTHVRIEGPSAWELDNAFRDFWNEHKQRRQPRLFDRGALQWQPKIRSAINSPNKLLYPVRGLYIEALDRAHQHVWITQAYFIPDRDILDALIRTARRGVDVKVLIPEVSNHIAADWVARSYYLELLEAGIEIWLYQKAMVHAKTAVIDSRWVTIGTANLDRMSLTGNYEINLEFFSTALAAHMRLVFETDMTNARLLTIPQWEERGMLERLGERLLRPLGPLM
ncbi:MAG: phospholipase D-like domain-containing protein [Actinomycetaceae bacterium]|nr:phospholipase D-like domain-containing protein [Actinomycetaceae bacterium]